MTPKPIRAGQHQGSSSVLLWTRQLQMAGKLKLTAKSLLNSVKDKQKTSHANITCPGKVVHVVILMPFEPELTRIFLRLSHLSSPSTAFLLLPPSPPPRHHHHNQLGQVSYVTFFCRRTSLPSQI